MTLQSPEIEAVNFRANLRPHLRGRNENKTKARRVKRKQNKRPESTGSLERHLEQTLLHLAAQEFQMKSNPKQKCQI